MASQRQSKQPVKEATIRALLDRYNCPTPFHAVRTRFLGALANPDPTVSPIDTVKALWGGELPTFDSIEAANELLESLVMGLWNRLARYQSRRLVFHLTPVPMPLDPAALAAHIRIRIEELDGFVAGLGGRRQPLLGSSGSVAFEKLAEIRSRFEKVQQATIAPYTSAPSQPELQTLHRTLAVLRAEAEHEMQKILVTATQVRRGMLQESGTKLQ